MTHSPQPTDFNELVATHSREIVAHCYRMLGSVEEAEDIAQETFLRVWKNIQNFEGRSSFRTWLYQIATNACIDRLRKLKRRQLILTDIAPSSGELPEQLLPAEDIEWLEPFPDSLLPDSPRNPEAIISQRESISLAFMVALQYLPPRQRAVLLLRDVLNWRGKEVAHFLEMTELAASSALNRARQTLKSVRQRYEHAPIEASYVELLARYIDAWETANIEELISLIKEDAIMTMPPLSLWFHGRDVIRQFITFGLFQGDTGGRWQLKHAAFNGLPAFALYRRKEDKNVYEPFGIQILTFNGEKIARLDNFLSSSSTLELGMLPSWHKYIEVN